MSDLTVSYDYLAELGIEIKEVANDVLANSTASNTRLYVNFKRIEPSEDEDAVQSRLLAIAFNEGLRLHKDNYV